MARNRQDRRNDFDEFYNNSILTFTEFCDCDIRAEKFEREYTLHICPGSRNGGTDKRIVEVSWGYRNYEIESTGLNWKAFTETGSGLLFERGDNGFVMVTLFPAHTEKRKPIESSITLKIWLDPAKLKDKHFLKGIWDDFISYTEYTSLDGNPTLFQRLRVSYLRNFKHLVIDNKWMPTNFSSIGKDILKYTVTVGLSGFIIVLVTLFDQPKEDQSIKQLEITNRKIEIILTKMNKIQSFETEIKNSSLILDNIKISTDSILAEIIKKKD